jgi:hypothetical protein
LFRASHRFNTNGIMNMIRKKPTAAPVDSDDVLAVLDARLRELDARRATITKQIITLEKTAGAGKFDASVDAAQAEALLQGVPFVGSRDRSLTQLSALHAERDVIDRALKIGRDRHQRLAMERVSRIWAEHFPQIAEIEKQRVFLALELQRINRQRETLRNKITAAGGAGFLSTDGLELLDIGDREDEVRRAAERLIADGIATAAEIGKARAG